MIRLIIKLICFFIPIKSWRKKCRKHINKYVEYIECKHIKNNYTQVIKKIKQKVKNNQKIKVAFLVSERQKWNCQQLYEKLEKSNIFEPMVLVTNIKGREKELKLNYDFFKNLNINVDWAYKDDKYIDLSVFNIDILFYQQPWEINKKQNIKNTSKFALSMYIPYAITNTYYSSNTYYKYFLECLHTYFIVNKTEKYNFINNISNKINFKITGHPKLDVYFDNKEYEKKYIIYAPHHSFEKEGLRYATFEWNGKEILEFAKKHKELNWVFKPHPRFKYSVVSNGILTQEECDKYFKDWEEIGLVYDSGNYFDLFKQSKCLITDCGSFLIEYFPIQNPVIVPISKDSKGRTNLANDILNSYYKVYNIGELNKCLEDVVLNNNDYMKNIRIEYLEKYKDVFNTNASENIINYLMDIINAK
ncbi:MAG: hypothetical protein J6C50_02315 [Rickettsiales bacterium]|nr:hypothetical protein [Rickettsiales bacterium]